MENVKAHVTKSLKKTGLFCTKSLFLTSWLKKLNGNARLARRFANSAVLDRVRSNVEHATSPGSAVKTALPAHRVVSLNVSQKVNPVRLIISWMKRQTSAKFAARDAQLKPAAQAMATFSDLEDVITAMDFQSNRRRKVPCTCVD